MSRPFAVLLALAAAAAVAVSVAVAQPDPATKAKAARDYWQHRYTVEHTLRKRVERRQGVRVRALRADVRDARRVNTLLTTRLRERRILAVHAPSSLEAIRLASIAYGQPYEELLRVAECESPGLDYTLVNVEPVWNGEHATGLTQFLPSTWSSTPYEAENILSPYASALAMGWMWDNHRRNEWDCR